MTQASTQVTTLYHVCRGAWDGRALEALAARREWSASTCQAILDAWPDLLTADAAWRYYNTDGTQVHCHATLDEAREFAAEFGGEILSIEIETDGSIEVEQGTEYPHPVIRWTVPADRVRRIYQ